ncbi:MAG TPA: HepT-like ribonuclease domain-containing protein [Acidisphaera sp.]|nr:HepT-like ribonuclease domain-containing protein [Acidisphaera sp.]
MRSTPSSPEAVRRWLNDIRHHVATAEEFVAGIGYETFQGDTLRLYAVIRCLEIISEASRRLPDELKARHPSIAWRDMAAAGNIYRHEYEDVAAREVWDTVTLHLPPLRDAVTQEVATFENPGKTIT